MANSAKMLTSAKNCSRQQIFLSCIFTFQAILSIFIFADSANFWSKIAEVSSAYIRVYSFSLSFKPSFECISSYSNRLILP